MIGKELERALAPHGFARRGLTFVLHREPNYWVVRVFNDKRRGVGLVVRVISELESRAKGLPVADPFRDGVSNWESGPAFLSAPEFAEWEIVSNESDAALLATRWARWVTEVGFRFFLEGSRELNERYRA
ncbi:MAG: hypothetical protein QM704_26530 [Anaeromyxobacteraceae bacterium]